MKIIVFVSKTGDWLVSFVAAILATVMLLYGGYALWDTAMLYQGAFVSQNLMKYKPSVSVAPMWIIQSCRAKTIWNM